MRLPCSLARASCRNTQFSHGGSMYRALIAIALVATVGALADAQSAKPPCNRQMVLSPDSLRAIATRLHPESADTAKRRAQVTVGLVFDSECRLVHHAVGDRTGPASADV